MSTKSIKLKIPFQTLLEAIDGLPAEEKLIIKERLEQGNDKRLKIKKLLKVLSKKNFRYSKKEIEEDIRNALLEVRGIAKN